MKIDYRKKSQYIKINNYDVYVWLYKKENYIGYGIQGTSFHKCLNKYKDKFIYIGKLINENNMRVDIHENEYCVLNSVNKEFIIKSIKRLA